MARRRRKTQTQTRTRRTSTRRSTRRNTLSFEVKSSVMREIWAVLYLALGVMTFLSLRNSFGMVGEIWVAILKPILGWGILALPVIFLGASLMLFFSRKVVFPLSRIIGIFFLMIAILSIIHLSVPIEELYSVAKEGGYGGYVGFVTTFLLLQVLNVGRIGAGAIFLTLLLVSVLLTFEVSIRNFLAFFNPNLRFVRRRDRTGVADEAEEEQEVEAVYPHEEGLQGDETPPEMIKIRRHQISAGDDEEEQVVQVKIVDSKAGTAKAGQRAQGPTGEAPLSGRAPVELTKKEALVQTEQEEQEDQVWVAPDLDLLNPAVADVGSDDALLKDNAEKIYNKLAQFGLEVAMHEVHVGPTVIQYTLRPHEGIKLSKITTLKNDLALALAAKAIRIEAPIPGKSLVGIEVPNDHRTLVHLREILESKEYKEIQSQLRLPLGRDVSGKPVCGDLGSMPHLLIAGATGSGKSVGMNTFLVSLLYQNSPADLRLIMIDPKRVELNAYNGIPHLLTPVITDPEKAAIALRWAVAEMNRRYQLCAENKHRDIADFNSCEEVHEEGRDQPGHQEMPRIVIVIDELADLMMAAGKEVEASICRIAQMARAVGMHLIVATQRPSVDVITGLIKANIPARIAFAVSSSIDSRTILDGTGAEDLLGRGDMLYLPGGMAKPLRVQGIYISGKEIERVVNVLKIAAPPNYLEDIISPRVAQERVQGIPESNLAEADDEELYQQALQIVIESRKASASLLQRRLKLGYARAARLLDLMEQNGVIGPVNGAKAREIYM